MRASHMPLLARNDVAIGSGDGLAAERLKRSDFRNSRHSAANGWGSDPAGASCRRSDQPPSIQCARATRNKPGAVWLSHLNERRLEIEPSGRRRRSRLTHRRRPTLSAGHRSLCQAKFFTPHRHVHPPMRGRANRLSVSVQGGVDKEVANFSCAGSRSDAESDFLRLGSMV